MANEPQSAEPPSLFATVERCLTSLQSLSLVLDTATGGQHVVARLWQRNYVVQSRRGHRAADAQVSVD
jgi:hypothetical protein